MKTFVIRRWVHRISGTAVLVLLVTGTLVTLPDLRTAVIGGQGRILSDIHLWIGLAFVLAPLMGLLYSKGSIIKNIARRLLDSSKIHWRRIHPSTALISGMMMCLTGPIMWLDSIWEYPVIVMDGVFLVHLTFAWVLGLALPMHLVMARRGIGRTIKKWAGIDKNQSGQKPYIQRATIEM